MSIKINISTSVHKYYEGVNKSGKFRIYRYVAMIGSDPVKLEVYRKIGKVGLIYKATKIRDKKYNKTLMVPALVVDSSDEYNIGKCISKYIALKSGVRMKQLCKADVDYFQCVCMSVPSVGLFEEGISYPCYGIEQDGMHILDAENNKVLVKNGDGKFGIGK